MPEDKVITQPFNNLNDASKAEMIANYRQIQGSAGWKWLVATLRHNIETIESQLLSPKKSIYRNDKEDILLKAKRLAYLELIELPDIIIKQLEKGLNPSYTSADPYKDTSSQEQ